MQECEMKSSHICDNKPNDFEEREINYIIQEYRWIIRQVRRTVSENSIQNASSQIKPLQKDNEKLIGKLKRPILKPKELITYLVLVRSMPEKYKRAKSSSGWAESRGAGSSWQWRFWNMQVMHKNMIKRRLKKHI